MRLDKYLASVSDYSRSDVKKLCKAGRVTVAGVLVGDAGHNIEPTADVQVDGASFRRATARYFMLNKPLGYISATKDREHLTALELLDEDNLDKMHIAGRLDIDTTGLVLISDDGQWSHRITSPKSHCPKTYFVETVDPISPQAVEAIEKGIHLNNEKRPTKPAKMVLVDEHSARLTISEGKYHQVKRMLAAVGNKVDRLHRESIGEIELDKDLMPGEYRALTDEEISSV